MILVAFSVKTSKILPRIFCWHFRHVAPIICDRNNKMLLYQFVRRGHIVKIPITKTGLNLLKQNGWVILQLNVKHKCCDVQSAWTCVDLTKRTIGVRAPFIQTPDALYKRLIKK